MSNLNDKGRRRGFNSETDFNGKTPPAGHQDWREALERFLITGGTQGRKQSIIVERFQNWVVAETIVEHLESLRADERVQKFRPANTGRGRAPTIWRATAKILEPE